MPMAMEAYPDYQSDVYTSAHACVSPLEHLARGNPETTKQHDDAIQKKHSPTLYTNNQANAVIIMPYSIALWNSKIIIII